MKSQIFHKSAIAAIIALMFTIMLTASQSASAQFGQKPDLRVASISSRTRGGFCAGNENKVMATIQNSQNIGVRQPFTVILRIQFPNGGQGNYTTTISSIGPRGNQSAWFHNVNLPSTGNYAMTVIADPTNVIAETVENNNARSQNFTVQNPCNAPPPVQTYTLTVKVRESDGSTGAQGQWIAGASVLLRDSASPPQFNPRTATTNGQGVATFANVPPSKPGKNYEITASRAGCGQVQGSPTVIPSAKQFIMGAYNSTQHLALDCEQ